MTHRGRGKSGASLISGGEGERASLVLSVEGLTALPVVGGGPDDISSVGGEDLTILSDLISGVEGERASLVLSVEGGGSDDICSVGGEDLTEGGSERN